MTSHPVTKEELSQIIDLTERIGDTGGWVKEVQPIVNERMKLLNEILSRPDPLALLEAYTYNRYIKKEICVSGMEEHCEIRGIIMRLKDNPSAVREQGIKEGW